LIFDTLRQYEVSDKGKLGLVGFLIFDTLRQARGCRRRELGLVGFLIFDTLRYDTEKQAKNWGL